MKVTEVRIRLANEDLVKAYASICFDDCFLVHDIRDAATNANTVRFMGWGNGLVLVLIHAPRKLQACFRGGQSAGVMSFPSFGVNTEIEKSQLFGCRFFLVRPHCSSCVAREK